MHPQKAASSEAAFLYTKTKKWLYNALMTILDDDAKIPLPGQRSRHTIHFPCFPWASNVRIGVLTALMACGILSESGCSTPEERLQKQFAAYAAQCEETSTFPAPTSDETIKDSFPQKEHGLQTQAKYHEINNYHLWTEADFTEKNLKAKSLVQLALQGPHFILLNFYTHEPQKADLARYTTPDIAALIHAAGDHVHNGYAAACQPPEGMGFLIVGSSLTRTEEYHDKYLAAGGNPQAAKRKPSSHKFANAADLDFQHLGIRNSETNALIVINDQQYPVFMGATKTFLYKFLADKAKQNKAYVNYEAANSEKPGVGGVFHVVGKKSGAKEPDFLKKSHDKNPKKRSH